MEMEMNTLDTESLLNGGAMSPPSLSPAVSLGSLLDPKDADLLKPSTEEVDELLSALENTTSQPSFSLKTKNDDSFIKDMLSSEIPLPGGGLGTIGSSTATTTITAAAGTTTPTTIPSKTNDDPLSSPLGGLSLSAPEETIVDPLDMLGPMSTSESNLMFQLDLQQFTDNSNKLDEFIAKGGMFHFTTPDPQPITTTQHQQLQSPFIQPSTANQQQQQQQQQQQHQQQQQYFLNNIYGLPNTNSNNNTSNYGFDTGVAAYGATALEPTCEEVNNVGEKRRRVPRRGSMPTMFKYSTGVDVDPFEPTPLAPSFNQTAITTSSTAATTTTTQMFANASSSNNNNNNNNTTTHYNPQPQHYFQQNQAVPSRGITPTTQSSPHIMDEDLEERPAKAAAIEDEEMMPSMEGLPYGDCGGGGNGGRRRQRRRSSLPAISLNYKIPGQDPEISIVPKTTITASTSTASDAAAHTPPPTEVSSSFYATTKSFVSSSSAITTTTSNSNNNNNNSNHNTDNGAYQKEENTLAEENSAFTNATSGDIENPFAPRFQGRRRMARRGSTGSFYAANTSGVGLEGGLFGLGYLQQQGEGGGSNNNDDDDDDDAHKSAAGTKIAETFDPIATMKRLKALMAKSAETQQSLQQWDKRNGLPKSHSQTMVNSSRSRKQLQDGVILPKWDGTPLINDETELGKPKPRSKKKQDGNDTDDMNTTDDSDTVDNDNDDNDNDVMVMDGPICIDEHMMGGKMRRRMSAPATSSFLF